MHSQQGHHDDRITEQSNFAPFSELEAESQSVRRSVLDEATQSAKKAAIWGPLPFILLLLFSAVTSPALQAAFFLWIFVLPVLASIFGFGFLYVAAIGNICGWLANAFASGTRVPVKGLAITIVWVVNLSLWGGMVVLAMTGS